MVNNIRILKIKGNDIEKIRVWRNKQIHVLRQKNKISRIEQLYYFKNNIFKKKTKNILFLLKDGKKNVAYGGLTNINFKKKISEISFLFNPVFEKNENFYYFEFFLIFLKKFAKQKKKIKFLFTETYSFRKNFLMFYKKNNFKFWKIKKNTGIYKNKKFNSIFFKIKI